MAGRFGRFYLGLPNACAAPGSLWMFHRSRSFWGGQSAVADAYLRIATLILPHELRAWVLEVADAMTVDDELWLAGQDLIEAGWIRSCAAEGGRSPDEIREVARNRTDGFISPRPLPVRSASS